MSEQKCETCGNCEDRKPTPKVYVCKLGQCHYTPYQPKPAEVMPLVTDDFGYSHKQLLEAQRDADLDKLAEEKRKWAKQEADWLLRFGDGICNETCGSTFRGCGAGCNASDQIESKIADLKAKAGE